MKILICILNFSKSGGSRVLAQFANYWIKEGHEVTFLSSTNSIEPYFPTQAKIAWYDNKGNIHNKPELKKVRRLNGFVKQIAMYKALNKIGNQFDIVLATHSLTALPVSLSKISAKKFYYIQAYEADYYAYRKGIVSKFLNFYVSKTYKLKNLNRVVNAPVYYEFKKLKTSSYVPCGLDLDLYYPKSDINFNSSPIKIGAIGRIEVFKGTTYVVEAVKQLAAENPSKSFMLYLAFGDKNLESDLIKCPQPNGDKELAEFYRQMDIIIAPGTTQFGAIHYPVIEAMACGTPIITTFYMPATESNAWLVEPHNAKAIAKQVNQILTNQDAAIEKAKRAILDVEQFEWGVVAQKMVNYFKNES